MLSFVAVTDTLAAATRVGGTDISALSATWQHANKNMIAVYNSSFLGILDLTI